MKINAATQNACADAVTAQIDGGTGAAHLRIYTGTAPAGPGSAPTGTLLVDLPLNDPSFGAASGGVATLNVSGLSVAAAASGTAGYARLVDSTQAAGSGLGVADLTVSATGGGGEVQLASTSISSGVTVTVTSGTITMPAT